MATEHLLDEFPPVATEAWEAAIVRDLKGADYNKRLVWQSPEGLAVKPYYRSSDLKGLSWMGAAPSEFPFVRGNGATGDWRIREEIAVSDAAEANRMAVAAVAAGAEEIAFTGVSIDGAARLELLLKHLDEIHVHVAAASEQVIELVLERLKMQPNASRISTGSDALANVDFAAKAIAAAPAGFVPFSIHAEKFETAGATAVEEIGFALAAGVDFLAAMSERGVDAGRAVAAIEFSFAVGSNFFFEMAKLRAFRMAWAQAAESFGVAKEAARARITARTSRWNKTVYDPHVNVLRATTEAMSAALGGASSVVVAPFDECYRQPDEASRRLARNTQLLLKHEALLSRVCDPGGGSYYLETLTDFLAREGWKRLQEIESKGGFRKAEGAIAEALAKSQAAREKAVVSRRRVLVGTNQYANAAERALEQIDEERMHGGPRGALVYEELRLRTERHAAAGGKTPRVLLAEIGDVKMRAARSGFTANFFACAGFEMVTQRFKKAEEIAAEAADLIVLCSSDPEYAELVAGLLPKLQEAGRATPVLIAGNPEGAEQLAAQGVADFVHVRSNPVEVLSKWQQKLGIGN